MVSIEGERAPSWNGMYAGMHWSKRNKIARAAHYKVREALGDYDNPFDCVVDIHLVASYKGSTPDSDNVVAKIYIDGLKGRVIHEDDGRWVRRVTTEAVSGSEDRVTIIVTPVEEE